jgi:hypothetical protein
MKKKYGKNVFSAIGYRARDHIINRLCCIDDADSIVKYPGWKEIDLYNFVKSAINGDVFVMHTGQAPDISSFSIFDPTEKSYESALAKSLADEKYHVEDFNNAPLRTILNFYIKNHDSAEPNDLFLNLEGDRAYGFYVLNVHAADIDVNMSKVAKDNHLMIRYNENTYSGWETRMQYISNIFSHMGFNTNIRGGYLHMIHPKPGDEKAMEPLLTEAIRGLVSTTHLNLTFGYAPESLDDAIIAFNRGTTNVHDYLESLPYVAEQRAIHEAMMRNNTYYSGKKL